MKMNDIKVFSINSLELIEKTFMDYSVEID